MPQTTKARESIWMKTAEMPQHPTLTEDLKTKVCIVGGGIAGLTTAYQLALAGQEVIVLDQEEIGSGETGYTTAQFVNALDTGYQEIERLHGQEAARTVAESHTRAIHCVEEIVATEQIECRFERLDGYWFAGLGRDTSILDRELEAAQRAGLLGVERIPRAPLPSYDTGPCLRFLRQAQFHPLMYLAGLAKAIERLGGRIYGRTHAAEFQGGSPSTIKTENGRTVTADFVVVATNTPVNDFVTMHTKQSAYRTYVVGIRIPLGTVTKGLYWDTHDPYHYVSVYRDGEGDALIVGGEDHKTGQAADTAERFQFLLEWAQERFPMAQEILHSWSGQVMEPVDGLAFIGRNPGESNVYIATGFSGNGMTYGTIAGMLLSDLILGKENPWTQVYDPARITLRAAAEFAKENLNVAAQYGELVTSGDIGSVEELSPGTGAIVRRGLEKIAAFRDDQGRLHEFNALCPHLKCVVNWNAAEKTWDCPCHGSRFDCLGTVINGPALGGLTPAEPEHRDRKVA